MSTASTTTSAAAEAEPVWCQRCLARGKYRAVTSPASRARRIGDGCWRKLRALRRRQQPVPLPGLGAVGPVQTGPDLLTTEDVDQAESLTGSEVRGDG